MKQFILTTIACILLVTTYAQANKSVFLEIGGNGMLLSVNFDSRLNKSEKGLGYRVGIGGLPPTGDGYYSTPFLLTIPVGVNYLVGKAPDYFESGLGLTYMYTSNAISPIFIGHEAEVSGSFVSVIPSIGYRHAKTGKGFQYRVFLSPTISKGAAFWAGFSLGFKF